MSKKKKTVHVTVRINEDIIKKIDNAVSGTSLTRSSYINKILEAVLK